MNWTNEEKLSLIRVLGDIVRADGDVDENELKILALCGVRIGFNAEEIPVAMTRDVDLSMRVLDQMSDEKKKDFNLMMMATIEADGIRDQNEIDIWFAVFKRLGIDKIVKR